METAAPVVYPLALSGAQAMVLQRALAHELVRVAARARDERLGDETRELEIATHRELRGLLDRLRRLAP